MKSYKDFMSNNIRWKDQNSAKGYDHQQEFRRAEVTRNLLTKMTLLEQEEVSPSALPSLKVLENKP